MTQDTANDNTTATKPKGNRPLMWASLLLIIVAALFLWNPWSEKKESTVEQEPAFHRDEPVQEQILEADYRQKIEEMIDSGKTVAEISKETGLRKDLIRKIKKEKGKTEE
ncbi:MAG: hypothetical protein IPH78_14230 [Bacteroidetes bacterium]|nr:hypothetical protein [Bacteroidota bacterium]